MFFDGRGKVCICAIIVLIIVAINSAVILVFILENSSGTSSLPYLYRCNELPVMPDQNYSIFSPVHMLAIDDGEFADVPVNRIPSVYHTIIPVMYYSSDGSFSIEEVFGDEYSFDYYLDATEENMSIYYTPDLNIDNLSVIYSPDVKLDGNKLSFDILIVNRGNEDIEISNVSVKYSLEQVNGQCDSERKLISDYAPEVLIPSHEFREIRVEVTLLSPSEAKNLNICKYFDEDIQYQENVVIEITKKDSHYSYATNLRFKIKSFF
ncbi:hypothetical protein [Methanoplanus limicola]|uniref:Uncharacterized protein n=1 Tax=Methanoplanus limicola DSM 2279 TaxID=937775 RepID=H1YZD1_9EURY|nr:hypothetical protein [Methanoplanus limicola]EHQ35155.1 hypothetical protein Metlim_1039 [Methanoplanus limicola DSM 2279]